MGEPSKVQILQKILEVIKRDNLLKNVNETGAVLMNGLKDLQVSFIEYEIR